ncbi:MAG: hypothetical protein ACI82I_002258 [Gammaproteobacteria bacterium]
MSSRKGAAGCARLQKLEAVSDCMQPAGTTRSRIDQREWSGSNWPLLKWNSLNCGSAHCFASELEAFEYEHDINPEGVVTPPAANSASSVLSQQVF